MLDLDVRTRSSVAIRLHYDYSLKRTPTRGMTIKYKFELLTGPISYTMHIKNVNGFVASYEWFVGFDIHDLMMLAYLAVSGLVTLAGQRHDGWAL